MSLEQPKQKPAAAFRDGTLKATIWKNEKKPDQESGEIGHFYSVDLSRSYRDGTGNWKETTSFSGAELLRVANLAQAAYNYILDQKRQDKAGDDAPA